MKRSFLVLVLAGLLALAAAQPAAATTTKIAFTGTSVMIDEISEGESWIDGSVFSRRNMVWGYQVTSDEPKVAGYDTVVINFDFDLETWGGTLWGKDRLVPSAHPDGWYDCTWQGTWDEAEAFAWSGKVVCHGGGTLRGWQLRYVMGSAPEIAGYLFLPGH